MPHLTGLATHPTPNRGPPLQTGPSSVPASNRNSPPSQTNQNVNGLGIGYHFTQLSSTPEFKERLDRLFNLSPEAPTNGVNGYESAGASGGPNAVAVPPPSDEPSRSSVNSNLQATSNHSFSRVSAPSTALQTGYLPTNQNNADKYDFSYLTAPSFPGPPALQDPHGTQPPFPQFGYWQPQGASSLASSTQTMGQNYTLGGAMGLNLRGPPHSIQTSQYSGSSNTHLRGQQRGFEDVSFGPERSSGQIISASTSQRLLPSAEFAHNQGFRDPSLPTTSLTPSTFLPSSERADVPQTGFAFEYATPSAEDEVHTPNFADPSAQLDHPVVTGKVELVAQMSQRFNIPRHFVFPATERPPQGFKTWDEYQGRIKRLMRHPMYERLAEAFARGRWLDFLQEMSRCFPNEQGGMILRRVSFIAQGLGLPSDDFILGAARTFLRWFAPNKQAISTNPSFALMVQTVWMIIQPNQHLLWGEYRDMIVPYLNRSVLNPITSVLVQTAEPRRIPRTGMVRTANYGSHATGSTSSRHSENQSAHGRSTRYAPY